MLRPYGQRSRKLTLAKTLFIVTVSTARLIFPGMPGMPGAPEAAKPPAVKSLSIEVASDAVAVAGSKATVAVPEGLKAGKTIDLQIDRAPKPAEKPEATRIKLMEYWGSGTEIGADQPKVTAVGTVAADAAAENVPGKSDAYWPRQDSKALDDATAVPGTYALKTDYCGGTSVTLGKEQSFLDPIDITSAGSEPDLDKPIVIRWRPVANAAGYLLKAFGGDDKRSIIWTSSAKPELARGIEDRPIGKDELAMFIREGVLIPSYVASCTIPAGVFKGSTSVMLIMTAMGKDMSQTKDGIETRVIVRSTGGVPLHSAPVGPPRVPKNADRDNTPDE